MGRIVKHEHFMTLYFENGHYFEVSNEAYKKMLHKGLILRTIFVYCILVESCVEGSRVSIATNVQIARRLFKSMYGEKADCDFCKKEVQKHIDLLEDSKAVVVQFSKGIRYILCLDC